jgi:hypothetical protein
MKIVLSTSVLLAAGINGQASRVNVPATPKAGIATILEDAFPTHLNELKKHGCWCAYAHSDNTDGMGGVKPVDYLDDLCRRWFTARRCTVLKDGDCRNDKDDSYILMTDPWYSCYRNSNVCDKSTCAIDIHFKELIEEYIDDLVASDGSYAATEANECIRVFPIERPAAPHQMKSTFYCTGEAPDVRRTDFYDDSFTATEGAFTVAQVKSDSVRATASDAPIFMDLTFSPTSDADEWTLWKIDVSGDIELVKTFANETTGEYSTFVSWPWLVTKGQDDAFVNNAFMCGYAAAPGKNAVSFTIVGDSCTVG